MNMKWSPVSTCVCTPIPKIKIIQNSNKTLIKKCSFGIFNFKNGKINIEESNLINCTYCTKCKDFAEITETKDFLFEIKSVCFFFLYIYSN